MKAILVQFTTSRGRLSGSWFSRPARCIVLFLTLGLATWTARAQINTGSDGHDGALNPTSSLVINMADHPDGIYQYSSVNLPAGVTVTFIPNAKNTPVTWLVQGSVTINGAVDVSGQNGTGNLGGLGGPGGWAGGIGGGDATSGYGPGGGGTNGSGQYAGGGQYLGSNGFLIPLIGGSGGGGYNGYMKPPGGGGGGGGAILIATSGTITVGGSVLSTGGQGVGVVSAGGGSGGGIRLVASVIAGNGSIQTQGGGYDGSPGCVRFDAFNESFVGSINGTFSQGFQPIIIPAPNQGVQLNIASVGGVAVAKASTGSLASPDVIVPGQQANPISIVVQCSNIALSTPITVYVTSMNGGPASAMGYNTTGSLASSTATVSVNLLRGGGLIYAQATTGLLVGSTRASSARLRATSYAQTGLTASGERFAEIEITSALGGKQQIAYLTESGKRYSVAVR